MADYILGTQVPLGGDAVYDFTVKKNGVPIDATALTIVWKKPDGVVVETDSIANGGIIRPPGWVTGEKGRYRVKFLIPTGYITGLGYTIETTGGTLDDGTSAPASVLKSYEVVASSVSFQSGGPTLASVGDVKDRLANISGITLPAGATDQRIQDILNLVEPVVLTRFGVARSGDLSANQQWVGKNAELLLAVGDLLVAFRPGEDASAKIATEYRKRAYDDLDQSRGAVDPTKQNRRLTSGLS